MRNADKPRVLVVFNSDYEGAGADPENVAREDIRGTAAGVVDALSRTGFAVDAMPLGEDVLSAAAEIAPHRPRRRLQSL